MNVRALPTTPRCKRVLAILAISLAVLAPTARASTTTNILVNDDFFSPTNVTIHPGDSVRWTWVGSFSHTSTSTGSLWDSGLHSNGFNFTNTFSSAGTFPYVCTLHAAIGMRGWVVVQGAANAAPVVAITSPTNHATFAAPWSGVIRASVSDPDGTVAKVDFYSGATLIGSVSSPGASPGWNVTNLAAGGYSFKAIATDNLGATNISAPILVSVVEPVAIALTSPQRISDTSFQLDFAATPGLSYVLERSSDLQTWAPVQTNTASSSLEQFVDTAAGANVNFYAVRLLPNP